MIRTYRILSSSRLGYRGTILLILAAIDIIYGSFLINPTEEQQRSTQFIWRDHIMSTQWWGAVWYGVAAVLIVSAFLRQDRVGYAVAIMLKVGWAFIAAIAGICGHAQGAWQTVAIFGGFAALTITESGRSEPLHTHEVTIINGDDRADE